MYFARSTVNHVTPKLVAIILAILTQNSLNDYYQWLFNSLKSVPNSFSTGAPPRTQLGKLTALPRPSIAGLRGLTSMGQGKGKKRGKGDRRGEVRNEKDPLRKFLDPPLSDYFKLKVFSHV